MAPKRKLQEAQSTRSASVSQARTRSQRARTTDFYSPAPSSAPASPTLSVASAPTIPAEETLLTPSTRSPSPPNGALGQVDALPTQEEVHPLPTPAPAAQAFPITINLSHPVKVLGHGNVLSVPPTTSTTYTSLALPQGVPSQGNNSLAIALAVSLGMQRHHHSQLQTEAASKEEHQPRAITINISNPITVIGNRNIVRTDTVRNVISARLASTRLLQPRVAQTQGQQAAASNPAQAALRAAQSPGSVQVKTEIPSNPHTSLGQPSVGSVPRTVPRLVPRASTAPLEAGYSALGGGVRRGTVATHEQTFTGAVRRQGSLHGRRVFVLARSAPPSSVPMAFSEANSTSCMSSPAPKRVCRSSVGLDV